MRRVSHIFWFLLLVMPVAGKKPDAFDEAMAELFGGAMGRECLFWHLENRDKRIDDQNHWVSLSGEYFGLVLRFGEKEKLVFQTVNRGRKRQRAFGFRSCSSRWTPRPLPGAGEPVSPSPMSWGRVFTSTRFRSSSMEKSANSITSSISIRSRWVQTR